MAIREKRPIDKMVHDAFDKHKRNLFKAIVNTLSYLGELCVTHARQNHQYIDQTGNLTASMGYLIAYNGKVIRSVFEAGLATATDGPNQGVNVARSKAREFPQGWVLVIVAGMNYATAVESRGLDVLTSAEQLAQKEVAGLLEQLKITVATA